MNQNDAQAFAAILCRAIDYFVAAQEASKNSDPESDVLFQHECERAEENLAEAIEAVPVKE